MNAYNLIALLLVPACINACEESSTPAHSHETVITNIHKAVSHLQQAKKDQEQACAIHVHSKQILTLSRDAAKTQLYVVGKGHIEATERLITTLQKKQQLTEKEQTQLKELENQKEQLYNAITTGKAQFQEIIDTIEE